MKGEVAMPTIFPREEKAEQLFEKILKNPDACERLKETFFDNLPDVDNPEADTRDVTGVTFTRALFQAYENKDLSAFLMAVCGNSKFDLLRNSFLIPIRFNDKGKTNPILLTDETGGLRKDIGIHVPEKTYQKFLKIYKNKEQIPQVEEYLAYGFREAHQYDEAGTAVESVEIGQHLGVLLLYRMPEEIKEHLTDAEIYVHVWDALMRVQDVLPRAFMYYGEMECGGQKSAAGELGIFLPMSRFGEKMERNIELANGIALGVREEMEAYGTKFEK